MFRATIIFLGVALGVPLLVGRVCEARWVSLVTLVVVAILARWALVGEATGGLLERLRTPGPSARRWIALIVGVCSICYLLLTTLYQHRQLLPRLHDEHCYLIQSRMLAAGNLWEPQHPLADFFDNFYLLSRPVYAPIYFPGTALFDVMFVKWGAPNWTMPILVSGGVVAMTYYLTTIMVDGVAGLIAVIALISTWGFREFSTIVMATAPMALLGLMIIWAWLAWRKNHRAWRALILGACMGWAAITRPVDAIAFAAPVGVAMLLDLRVLLPRQRFACVAAILIGILPFVLLQAVLNQGTTGKTWVSPYTTYLKNDQPGSEYGFHAIQPDAHPVSPLPQKTQYFQDFRLQEIRGHTLARLPYELLRRSGWTIYCLLPAGILAILLPVSLMGLTDLRRRVLWSVLPLFVLLYLPNPFFLAHYPVPFGPVAAFSIALAIDVLSRAGRGRTLNGQTSAFLPLVVLAVCISSLPEARQDVRDGTIPAMPLMAMAQRELASAVDGAAVVLFRYSHSDNPVEEPVYNDDVAWPDDAAVIRAHDLGSRDIEIARYYAARQPWRKFYLLDRQENVGRKHLLIHFLGDAKAYAASFETR